MFLLMRHWEYDDYAGMCSAIVFMFGGYMISILDNVAFLTAAVWLPLIVLAYDRFLKGRNRLYLVLTGVLVGLQILAGDASCYVLSTFIFMIAYHLFCLRSGKYQALGSKARSLWYIPCAWLIGILLSAIVLIPFAEYVFSSTRMGGFSYEEMTKWSYHPLELLQLLVPYLFGSTVPMCRWFGQFWLDTFYIGVLPILLVIFSLRWSRNGMTYFFIGVVICSCVMAFGKYTPLFSLIRYIPGLNVIHYPVKYLFLAGFSLAVLAGMGFSALFERLKQGQTKGLDLFLLVTNVMAIVILFAAMLLDDLLFKAFQAYISPDAVS